MSPLSEVGEVLKLRGLCTAGLKGFREGWMVLQVAMVRTLGGACEGRRGERLRSL